MPLRKNYRDAVNRTLKGDSSYRKYVMSALEVLDQKPSLLVKFADGELKLPFMDIYCQVARPDQIYFEDLVLVAIAWQHILNGQLIYRFIEVSDIPQADNEIQKNRKTLNDLLKHYNTSNTFKIESADFWAGTQAEDGYIEFSEPFIKSFMGLSLSQTAKSNEPEVSIEPVDGSCTYFPLEVGYCMPDQIETHLAKARCVARFPYGYNVIVFLESKRKWNT